MLLQLLNCIDSAAIKVSIILHSW